MRMKMQARKDIPILPETKPVTRIDFGDHYPDGGWGWVVVVTTTLIYMLCHGFHYAYGTLFMKITDDPFKADEIEAVWLGSFGISMSLFLSPLITTICQRKSPRLYAALGGLIISLGCLFLAFSKQMEQFFISHGIVLSVGTGMTVNTANVILGRYFRDRREVAEMIMVSGTGAGAALISFLLDDLIRKLQWIHAMQSMAGLLSVTMIAGAMYRSASLYHPRRNVILHIKNQKKCRREREQEKASYFDFTALRKMRGLQGLMVIVAVVGLGIHVPYILLLKTAKLNGVEDESLVLLNVFLGVGYVIGCLVYGYIVIRDSSECAISRRHLTQACALASGAFTLLLVMAKDFHAFSLFAWAYGVSSGGYYYTLKMYTYELVKEKIMERGWGFVNAAQFFSFLLGPPLAIYLNEMYNSDLACYVFAGVLMIVGGLLFFFMPLFERHYSNQEIIQRYQCACSKNTTEAAALLDLDLTNAMVTKPLNNVQFIVSPSRVKHSHQDGSKIQMQCFIQHRDKEKPKQIVLSRITEEKEGLRLDFNEISQMGANQKSASSAGGGGGDSTSARKHVSSDKDLSLPVCEKHCMEIPSEGTNSNSNHTDKSNKDSHASHKKFRRSSDNVKVDYFDPPSQEKESTATVSYDSDLYINLCEAQV